MSKKSLAVSEEYVPPVERFPEAMAKLLLRCRIVLAPFLNQTGLVEDIASVLRLYDKAKSVEDMRRRTNGVSHEDV